MMFVFGLIIVSSMTGNNAFRNTKAIPPEDPDPGNGDSPGKMTIDPPEDPGNGDSPGKLSGIINPFFTINEMTFCESI